MDSWCNSCNKSLKSDDLYQLKTVKAAESWKIAPQLSCTILLQLLHRSMSVVSSDSGKSQMAFELFELVGLLRVRPRVSQQHSKGKSGLTSLVRLDDTLVRNYLVHSCPGGRGTPEKIG